MENIKAVLVFLLVFAFCSNGYLAIEELVPNIKEVYWYILLLGLSALILVLAPAKSISNIPQLAFIWMILFLISTTLAYAMSTQGLRVSDEVKVLLKAFGAFLSMFILLTDPKLIKAAFYALILVILVGVGVNVIEFFTDSIEWSSIPGRAAGWHYNANKSGKFLVMSLIFASIVVPRKLLWPLILVTTAGVLLTFSRSTWVELCIAIIGISLIRTTPVGQRISLLNIKPLSFIGMVVGASIAAVLLSALFSGQAYKMIKDTRIEGHLSSDAIGRLSGDFTDSSTSERKRILIDAIKVGLKNPVAGAGLSYTYEWDHGIGPHNDFAKLFAERGGIGLAVYLALIGLLWFKGGRHAKLFVMVLAFSSVATHNTFEQPGMYIFFALALLYKENQHQTAQPYA